MNQNKLLDISFIVLVNQSTSLNDNEDNIDSLDVWHKSPGNGRSKFN